MNDSYQHKGLRKKLVDQIRKKGIKDERVLDAINSVPRHLFMDSSFIHFSYSDQAFPIGAGQTISQPYTVAFKYQLLERKTLEKVLEVGTGSGYQAAVLVEMGVKVFTIERHRELFLRSQSILRSMKYNPEFFYGDGYRGVPGYAPFDKILVTAGAPEVPEELLKQLRIGGIMVVPVGIGDSQRMIKIVREEEDKYIRSEHGSFIFVPLLKGKAG